MHSRLTGGLMVGAALLLAACGGNDASGDDATAGG